MSPIAERPAGTGIWLVVGVQAAGKSTVAELLARRFHPAAHVRGGQFYRWATSGWVHPAVSGLSANARRLLDLRYRLSGLVADEYATEGFTAIVQDNIFGADVVRWLERVRSRPRQLVVLRPSIEAVASREAARCAATGKVAYRPGEFTIAGLDALLDGVPRVGLWLDTSEQTPDETVGEIITRQTEALIETADLDS